MKASARWGLVASDRYALVRGLPEEVLRVVFEAFTLAQPERGPHCHGGGLGTEVEADDAVLRCATPLDVAGPLAVAKKADTRRRRSRITSYAHHRRSRCSARGPQQRPPHPPACVSACVSNVPAPAAPSAPLRAASSAAQVAAIAVRIPLIKSDSNVLADRTEK